MYQSFIAANIKGREVNERSAYQSQIKQSAKTYAGRSIVTIKMRYSNIQDHGECQQVEKKKSLFECTYILSYVIHLIIKLIPLL